MYDLVIASQFVRHISDEERRRLAGPRRATA
jgi:hypothetical protein